MSTKIHTVVDACGLPVKLLLSAGQVSDKAMVADLLDGLRPADDTVADKGYDAAAILEQIAEHGSRPHIPTQGGRNTPRSVNRQLYRERNLVERFFNKLKHFRRIATRYDKLARNFLAAIALAACRLRIRHYESTT